MMMKMPKRSCTHMPLMFRLYPSRYVQPFSSGPAVAHLFVRVSKPSWLMQSDCSPTVLSITLGFRLWRCIWRRSAGMKRKMRYALGRYASNLTTPKSHIFFMLLLAIKTIHVSCGGRYSFHWGNPLFHDFLSGEKIIATISPRWWVYTGLCAFRLNPAA